MKFNSGSVAVLCALLAVISLQTTYANSAPADNVAVQWNALGTTSICSNAGIKVFGTGLILPHLHLAQWHALLALKGTGERTTEEAESQRKLGKRMGVAVALEVMEKKYVREYGLKEVKDDLTARLETHTPDPIDYIEDYLPKLHPPAPVPSDEWDVEYNALVNIGRVDWPGRTQEMNYTAAIYVFAKQPTKAGEFSPLTMQY